MKGKGPRHDRETVIVLNEEENTASIWTASEQMYRKLKRLGFYLVEDRDRSATFEVPKRLVSIRKERILSDSQREALRQRGKAGFKVKTHDNNQGKRT